MRKREIGLVLSLATALTALSSCQWGGPSSEQSTTTLEAQRRDVRKSAAALIAQTESGLPGTVERSGGRFEGCTSRFANAYRDFRYVYTANVRFSQDDNANVSSVAISALGEAGFTVTDDADPSPLGPVTRGEFDNLSASLYLIPEGDGGLAITVHGPCVEVPKGESDDWIARRDDEPPGG